ncbi:MAG: RNA 3'-terminal phosphate cyclase [Euryarchaeota archaeon]|nr:RNA 3'-terminal phosphate cyclase [Euryarchaeota archaeon]
MSVRWVEVDGSRGEGGGQILRTAVCLSALTGRPLRVAGIRRGRPRPGLAPQHIRMVEGARVLCQGHAEGLHPGSTEVQFTPGPLRGGAHTLDIGTAGSVSLALQGLLPIALAAPEPVELDLRGGTDVAWAPPIDYLRGVFLPLLGEMGLRVEVEVARRGYYPEGGGRVKARIHPETPRPLRALEPRAAGIRGVSHASRLPGVAERQAHAAREHLAGREPHIRVEDTEAAGRGSGVVLWSGWKGAGALGERGKPAEEVGGEAARRLLGSLGSPAALDPHLADQVLPYLALAPGDSEFTVETWTPHAESHREVLQRFLPCTIETEPLPGMVRVSVGGASRRG